MAWAARHTRATPGSTASTRQAGRAAAGKPGQAEEGDAGADGYADVTHSRTPLWLVGHSLGRRGGAAGGSVPQPAPALGGPLRPAARCAALRASFLSKGRLRDDHAFILTPCKGQASCANRQSHACMTAHALADRSGGAAEGIIIIMIRHGDCVPAAHPGTDPAVHGPPAACRPWRLQGGRRVCLWGPARGGQQLGARVRCAVSPLRLGLARPTVLAATHGYDLL